MTTFEKELVKQGFKTYIHKSGLEVESIENLALLSNKEWHLKDK